MTSIKEGKSMAVAPVTSIDMPSETQPVLKKKFTFLTAIGIALCCSGAWEGWTASLAQGLTAGGPVSLFWGWIFVAIGITFVATALAEMVSMWPSAGGQYVWVANLAKGQWWARTLSWYVAWISLTGTWLGMISCAMGVAVQVQSYVAVARDYEPKNWHAILITFACMTIWGLINVFYVKVLHQLNSGIVIVHFAFFFIVIGILAGCTEQKHDARFVFLHFENHTGWPSDGVAWCIGLLPALYAFFSLDAATHYCEEIENANVAVPRAMFLQGALNGSMTLPFVITVIFCMGDAAQVLSSPIGLLSPFTEILRNSTGNAGAAIFLNAVSTSVAFTAGLDLWGAAGRALWSMARDGGLPPAFTRIHPKFNVPVLALLVLAPPSIPIVLIYNWNTTAFYGIMSGVLVAFQISYAIPIGLNLFYARRVYNHPRGPFNNGRFGWVIDGVAFAFSLFMIIFMSFPVYYPTSAATMNYASAIIGAAIAFSAVTWFVYGKRHYNGPSEILDGVRNAAASEDVGAKV